MSRPKKSADERKDVPFVTRMDVPTRERLASKTDAAGLSSGGEWIRRQINDAPMPNAQTASADPALVAALNAYTFALKQIGNNVNQLTAANWQGRDFVKYWHEIGEELKADLAAGREALSAAIEAIEG
jgi:hypothetical protein